MNKKRIIILTIIFVLLIICLFISISYSYYMIGNNKAEIETAMETPDCVGVSIHNNELFSLKGDYAVPITNAQFLNSKEETQNIYKYSFTINSSCEGQDLSDLEIGLVPLNDSSFPITNLKFILIKTEDNNNSFTEDNINSFNNKDVKKLSNNMIKELQSSYNVSATHVYPVGNANFDNSNSVSYDLYVWISSDTGNVGMDKEFKATIVLYKGEETLIGVLLKSDYGDGELIQHTEELENGAKDDGYRYVGNDPNNFICFGKGSEKYNNKETDICPLNNKYRIIGYVPVTLKDNQSTSLIKVIKAEYLTEDEFKLQDGTVSNTINISKKRIENTDDVIPGYHWNDTQVNNWEESSLYLSLNSEEFLMRNFDYTWLNKIETVTWNVGGSTEYKINSQGLYDEEMKTQGITETVYNKIGIMYGYDYGFACKEDCWTTSLYDYTTDDIKENNWLFNGVIEWTISRRSSNHTNAYRIDVSGSLNRDDVSEFAYAVRPVFYLKEDVSFVANDKIANGSKEHPFRVVVGEELVDPKVEVLIKSGVGNGELVHHDGSIMGYNEYDYKSGYSVTDSCMGKTYNNIDELILKLKHYDNYYILDYQYTPEEVKKLLYGTADEELLTKLDSYKYTSAEKALNQAGYDECIMTSHLIVSIDAEDGGYRYTGDDPNNFVCFGKGSENYNKGVEDSCPVVNKYRIIGYVPVTLDDDKTNTYLYKLIKAEYLTNEELTGNGNIAYSGKTDSYDFKRTENDFDTIASYDWSVDYYGDYDLNKDGIVNWAESKIYQELNSTEYLDKTFGSDWQAKIQNVTWNIGGTMQNYTLPAKEIYKFEMTNNPLCEIEDNSYCRAEGSGTRTQGLIGLMYLHDYSYASSKELWENYMLEDLTFDSNWIFNRVDEWTLFTAVNDRAQVVIGEGGIGSVVTANYYEPLYVGVRPVFYLKADVELINDGTAIGSKEHPFKIAI